MRELLALTLCGSLLLAGAGMALAKSDEPATLKDKIAALDECNEEVLRTIAAKLLRRLDKVEQELENANRRIEELTERIESNATRPRGAARLGPARAGKPIKVYLLGGQSNMVGSSTPTKDLPRELQIPQEDVEFYHSAGPGPLKEDAWVLLQPGSTVDFGPEVTFGRTMADLFPEERIVLIKYAAGNTNLAVDWNPNTGPQYRRFKETVTAGLEALTDRGDEYEIAGMVWMQGESDSGFAHMAPRYRANLTSFITRVRRDFEAPDMPFVIGRIYLGVGSFPHEAKVRAAQVAVGNRDKHAAWVNLDGLPQQPVGVEFNGPGTIEMGKRFAKAMQRLHKKAAPRATE